MEEKIDEIKYELKQIKPGVKFVIECTGFNHEGQGIAKITGIKDDGEFENFPLFIDELVVGEKGIVEITKVFKTYGYAKLTTLFNETRPVDHVLPKCKLAKVCGGCNIMHMSYPLQLKFKKEMVFETFKKIGKLEPNILPVIACKKPFEYRNKVQVPFRKKGYKTICGFFARDSHEVIPFEECFLQSDLSTKITNFVRNLCNEFKISGYNEFDNTGTIRHVLVRTSTNEKEVMVVLVVTSEEIKQEKELIKKLSTRYPMITSIIKNINPHKGNTVLGEKVITIYGKDYIEDELCGLKFRIGPKSFYQVNHDQTEILYNTAIQLAKLNQNDIVIDAYCGIGTIGLIASKYVKEVYSVEIIEEAIKNANKNALLNNIKNIHFVCNKAEKQIVKWYNEGIKASTIIVDPPRKGCDNMLLDTIVKMKIEKVIYVSCDPATLARDVSYLTENNYTVEVVQPVDMFPQTSHIETVVLLVNKTYQGQN